MTLEELAAILAGAGFPVAYYAFPLDDDENPPPPPPFVVYLVTGTNNFSADGVVYYCVKTVQVELYTDSKDPAAEAAVEKALHDAGIYWDRSEEYIPAERLWETIYTIEV